MPLYHTGAREHGHDSTLCLRPTGEGGTPLAIRYAALRLAKSRHGVTAATGATSASSVEAQAGQRSHTFGPSTRPYTNIHVRKCKVATMHYQ